MLKALVTHLLLREKETVIMDMVAGLEHLGRGTASAVDVMYIIVEPGRRSLDVAQDIARLASGLGIPSLWIVANKVRSEQDLQYVRERLGNLRLAGWLPYDERAVEADMQGRAIYDLAPDLVARVRRITEETGLFPAKQP